MADNRFVRWTKDNLLKQAIETYVKQGLTRKEALDFLSRDFLQYPWSIRTLDRRLGHFKIYYNDNLVGINEAKEAVKTELEGHGKLFCSLPEIKCTT